MTTTPNLNAVIENAWEEKYRPKTLSEIALNDKVRATLNRCIEDGVIPNLFLCSSPGQGKTSLAKILADDVFRVDKLYINASNENSVDTIRNKVTNFVNTKSIRGAFKIVIMDEIDGCTHVQPQRILRVLMEEVTENARFIIIANDSSCVLDALKSRCLYLDITPDKKEVWKRLLYILKQEGIVVDKESKEMLSFLARRYYPDIRQMIVYLKSCVVDGKLNLEGIKKNFDLVEEVYKLIRDSHDGISARKMIIENESSFFYDYPRLLDDLYKLIIADESLLPQTRAKAVIAIEDYLSRMPNIIDPELNCAACIFTLEGILNQA